MKHVLAAIDADQSARPVLSAAHALAQLLGTGVAGLHVDRDRDEPVAMEVEVELRHVRGDVAEQIADQARDDEVVAVAIGARAAAEGRRPTGSTTLQLITRIRKPVIVVPPDARPSERFTRLLVPLEEGGERSPTLVEAIARGRREGIQIVVLHLHSDATVPAFSDHEPHSTQAWNHEFLKRHLGPYESIEVLRRVGEPEEQIAVAATAAGADLIVLTWSQTLAGGHARVVSNTLAETHVPVLLLPSGRQPRANR